MSGLSSSSCIRSRPTVLAGLLAALVCASAARAADVIHVIIDEAKVIELPANTSTIIVGNPIVADVTMLRKNNRMVLTGKAFGRTNLIALDANGNAIGESSIRVSANFKGLVVQRGMDRESYDCSPRCQPTVSLGDSAKFLGETSGANKLFSTLSGGK